MATNSNLASTLEEFELDPDAHEPHPRSGARGVQYYLSPGSYAYEAFICWANHWGFGETHGLSRTGLVLTKIALRTLGKPPGFKGRWDPSKL